MAGTAGLKWKLLPITLLAFSVPFDTFDLTFDSGDDIYQCLNPTCRRVEEFDGGYQPHCCGTPNNDHQQSETRLVPPSEDLTPADNDHFFI